MTDKLSRDNVLTMAKHIPLMIEDLRVVHHKYYMRFKVRWDKYNKKGAMGHEIIDLYMKCRDSLPEDKQSKYP